MSKRPKQKKPFKLTPDMEQFVAAYVKAIEDRTAAVFAGAGLSIPAGFVDWRKLLKNIAKDIGLNIDKENDLIAVAQYHVNEKGGRHRINQSLVNEFSSEAKVTENHKILSRLPIQTYWTTNYDKLIESVLSEAGKTPDVKLTVQNLAINVPQRDAIVYKMHGDVSMPNEAVVTKDDYEDYSTKKQLFSTALQGDLLDKTFLFLGFSFSDPNIGYILSRIRVLLGKDQREHFCLMRKVQRSDYPSVKEFTIAQTRQALQTKDLRRFAINVILVEDYHDITHLLQLIEARVKRKRIFIGGSAAVYEPFAETDARQFIHDLSKTLVKNGYEVVTGFGLGVGDAVINGALDQVFSTKHRSLDRFLVMRPFPQFATGHKKRAELWSDYRKSMMDESGIAIFLFGNKKVSDEVVPANGLQEEFDIAIEKGIPVIPVGFTGSSSLDLWSQLTKNKSSQKWKTKSFNKAISQLGKAPRKLNSGIAKIMKIVQLLQNEGF